MARFESFGHEVFANSSERGHPMWLVPGPDGLLVAASPLTGKLLGDDEVLPCARCGAIMEGDEPDVCLGRLPGVKNACCGHGNPDYAYITFENGVTVRGFVVDKTAAQAGDMDEDAGD